MSVERRILDRELHKVEEALRDMHRIVDEALAAALNGFKSRDPATLNAIVSGDEALNELQHRVEVLCFEILATQQPVASDLRRVMTFSHIAEELERIGDHAASIAAITLADRTPPMPEISEMIEGIGARCRDMLNQAMGAYGNRDEQLARAVGEADNEVDRLQEAFVEQVIPSMCGSAEAARHGSHLLWTSHNLERVADRATNIAERVIFMVSGRTVGLN